MQTINTANHKVKIETKIINKRRARVIVRVDGEVVFDKIHEGRQAPMIAIASGGHQRAEFRNFHIEHIREWLREVKAIVKRVYFRIDIMGELEVEGYCY